MNRLVLVVVLLVDGTVLFRELSLYLKNEDTYILQLLEKEVIHSSEQYKLFLNLLKEDLKKDLLQV